MVQKIKEKKKVRYMFQELISGETCLEKSAWKHNSL